MQHECVRTLHKQFSIRLVRDRCHKLRVWHALYSPLFAAVINCSRVLTAKKRHSLLFVLCLHHCEPSSNRFCSAYYCHYISLFMWQLKYNFTFHSNILFSLSLSLCLSLVSFLFMHTKFYGKISLGEKNRILHTKQEPIGIGIEVITLFVCDWKIAIKSVFWLFSWKSELLFYDYFPQNETTCN